MSTSSKCKICKKKAVLIAGDCNYCGNGYCMKHRLPEVHNCENKQDCVNRKRKLKIIYLYIIFQKKKN